MRTQYVIPEQILVPPTCLHTFSGVVFPPQLEAFKDQHCRTGFTAAIAISKLSEKLPPFVAANVFAIDFSDRNSDINVVNSYVTACRHHVKQKVTF